MTSLKEKERRKEQQDKFQAILSALLKDDDNKYCVDCDAKGPRWASWNLGIFLCIRCAGIHRNLGVHISKVKSVNLDTWTPEQVAMMQEIGNSRARAAYEANLPDGYRRPQTDSALEAFIRSKYETKKYMAREWVPPQPKVPKEWLEDKPDRKKVKPKTGSAVQLTNIPKPSQPTTEVPKPQPQKVEVPVPKAQAPASSANDLLGLDLGNPPPQTAQPPISAPSSSGGNDLLELFGGPQPAATQPTTAAVQPQQQAQNPVMNGSSSDTNLFGEDPNASNGEKKASTKDSIMALFGGASSQPQMYGVPGTPGQYYAQGGMYLPQSQQMYPGMMGQQQQGMMGQPQQGMMGQPQQGMMGQPQQGMVGQPQQGMMGQPQQGMMGQPQQGMMGQPQQGMMGQMPGMMGQQVPGMMGQQPQGMMGQPQQNMMGNPAMNGSQVGVFGGQGQMMGSNAGVYTPQQMQQLQYQQMQQQMSSLKLAGGQMNAMPQQMPPGAGGGWGAPATGQTLSTNLWQ